MFGTRVVIKRGSKEEAEKPFWISFSDLMSALMVLFLVVMSVALLAVTKKVSEEETARQNRNRDITSCLEGVEQAVKKRNDGIEVNKENGIIDFGTRALFNTDSHTLTGQQAALLRSFVPEILARARTENCDKWLKQIVVEGYTDQTGGYLLNLGLSLGLVVK